MHIHIEEHLEEDSMGPGSSNQNLLLLSILPPPFPGSLSKPTLVLSPDQTGTKENA